MIRSMTGFGRATRVADGLDMVVEVKSVNNRFLKVSTRLPDAMASQELAIEKRVKAKLARGSVSLSIRLGSNTGDQRSFEVNAGALRRYASELVALGRELGLDKPFSVVDLARLPGGMQAQEIDQEDDGLLEACFACIDDALDACNASRDEEGRGLATDLRGRCQRLLELNEIARDRAPTVVADYQVRLRERLAKLLESTSVSAKEEDIVREVAWFADKADISEEIQRLASHCHAMIGVIDGDVGEAGRRLDFIAQEMLREANTMGSKANDADLVSATIEMKSEVEKIKEQVQNVE